MVGKIAVVADSAAATPRATAPDPVEGVEPRKAGAVVDMLAVVAEGRYWVGDVLRTVVEAVEAAAVVAAAEEEVGLGWDGYARRH